jgi:hypothetical protein
MRDDLPYSDFERPAGCWAQWYGVRRRRALLNIPGSHWLTIEYRDPGRTYDDNYER